MKVLLNLLFFRLPFLRSSLVIPPWLEIFWFNPLLCFLIKSLELFCQLDRLGLRIIFETMKLLQWWLLPKSSYNAYHMGQGLFNLCFETVIHFYKNDPNWIYHHLAFYRAYCSYVLNEDVVVEHQFLYLYSGSIVFCEVIHSFEFACHTTPTKYP